MATQVAAKIIGIVAATPQSAAYNGGRRRGGAGDGLQVRVATSGVRRAAQTDGKWRVEWGLYFFKFYLVSVCLSASASVRYIGFLNCCLDLLDIVTTSP